MKFARHADSITIRDGFVSIIEVETKSDGKVGAAGMETTRTSYFMETVAYNLQSEM